MDKNQYSDTPIKIGDNQVSILQSDGTYVPLTQNFLREHGWVLERDKVFAGKDNPQT